VKLHDISTSVNDHIPGDGHCSIGAIKTLQIIDKRFSGSDMMTA
jgi:hypothetical protein